MIPADLSRKITNLSFISIVLVLYIHSTNTALISTTDGFLHTINIFIQKLIGNGLALAAIPIFFMMSGFFLFKKFESCSYLTILRKRFYSLFIPYIFWSFLVLCLFYLLESSDYTQDFFTRTLIRDLSHYELFHALVLEPKNYPLWFLRDLIILVIVSPFIYYSIRKIKEWYFFIVIILWLFFHRDSNIALSLYKPDVLLFFSIGGYIALYRQKLLKVEISNVLFTFLLVSYIVLLLFDTLFSLMYGDNFFLETFLHKMIVVMGVLVIWFLLDRVRFPMIYFISNFTFLIYVIHEPLLTIYKKAFIYIFGQSSVVGLVTYLVVPLLIILTLIIIGYFMRKYMYSTSKIVLGNRI